MIVEQSRAIMRKISVKALSELAAAIELKMKAASDCEDEMTALDEEHFKIMRKLAATPARRVDDLMAKAERVLAYRDERPKDMHVDPDVAVALSIVSDLYRMVRVSGQSLKGFER
jgi:hypothetical protein